MSSSDDEHIAQAPINYRRGIFFIRLAVEQIRQIDQLSAQFIQKQYVEPLNLVFENLLSRIPGASIDSRSRMHELSQQGTGMDEWRKICAQQDLPLGPPGFGLKDELGLKEANGSFDLPAPDTAILSDQSQGAASSFMNPWGSSRLPAATVQFRGRPSSPATPSTDGDKRTGGVLLRTSTEPAQKFHDFGPIGPPKPSAILAARKAGDAPSTSDFASLSYDDDYALGQHAGTSSFTDLMEDISRPPPYQHGKSSTYLEDALAAYISEHKNASNAARLGREPEDRINVFANRPTANTSFSGYMSADDSFHSVETQKSLASSPPDTDAERPLRAPNASSRDINDASSKRRISEVSAVQQSSATAHSSWAKIAAIPKPNPNASATTNGKSPNITLTLASTAARLSTASTTSKTPKEPHAEQLRVVWLANLPRDYRSRDVSAHIVEGPVMSILLQTDAHETLPGLSACIIFMTAEHAAQYLAANNFSTEQGKQAGPTKYASDVLRATRANNPSAATDVTIIPGAPYPTDAALKLMGPTNHARRRVKWSRSRLFYDVSLRQFKRDVLALVGSASNVELFHFYNPGECTVVFSSVSVAAVVVEGFNKLRQERKLPGIAAVTTLEEEGRAGGIGEGRLDGKVGRYEGVEVGFVRDFNEAQPEALWSQYGRDGRLKSSSRAEGCEGIFEGPDVVV